MADNKRLALVIPFHNGDTNALLNLLENHWQRAPPCNVTENASFEDMMKSWTSKRYFHLWPRFSTTTDLVFYYSDAKSQVLPSERVQQKLNHLFKTMTWRFCFRNMYIIASPPLPKHNANESVDIDICSLQPSLSFPVTSKVDFSKYPFIASHHFFSLFKGNNDSKTEFMNFNQITRSYDAMAYLEPDSVPCRMGWLTFLNSMHRTLPSWIHVFGGRLTYPVSEDENTVNRMLAPHTGHPLAAHVNGNALYRNLQDSHFLQLINMASILYYNDPMTWQGGYDVTLSGLLNQFWTCMHQSKGAGYARYRKYVDRIQGGEWLQHVYRLVLNGTEICHRQPDAWLVHGRNVYWKR